MNETWRNNMTISVIISETHHPQIKLRLRGELSSRYLERKIIKVRTLVLGVLETSQTTKKTRKTYPRKKHQRTTSLTSHHTKLLWIRFLLRKN